MANPSHRAAVIRTLLEENNLCLCPGVGCAVAAECWRFVDPLPWGAPYLAEMPDPSGERCRYRLERVRA
jgi:hypothetical protein